jgi:hypothetical protein
MLPRKSASLLPPYDRHEVWGEALLQLERVAHPNVVLFDVRMGTLTLP